MHPRILTRAALQLAQRGTSLAARPTAVQRSAAVLIPSLKRGIYCTTGLNVSTSGTEHAQTKPLRRTDHTFTCGRQITEVERSDGNGWIEVKFDDGFTAQYPYMWLRDNCTCEVCFNPHSQSRISMLRDVDVDMQPKQVKFNPRTASVEVTWENGHFSSYSSDWLDGRSFTNEVWAQRDMWYAPPARLWGNQLQDNIPQFDFEKILTDDQTLYDWITTLQVDGLAVITGAPSELGQVERVGNRVAYCRRHLYGTTFQVRSKFEPSNLAYSPHTLPFHTDTNYHEFSMGMQMLHCIEQAKSEGGDNLFADGFHAAKILKEQHRWAYDILTTTPLDQIDIGDDVHEFFTLARRPVLELDREGNVNKISISGTRDSIINQPVEKINQLYRALKAWDDLLYLPENHIKYKMRTGDIACMHNHRVLHGRLGFTILPGGNRHLEAAYLDWDELNSRRRRLMMKLNMTPDSMST